SVEECTPPPQLSCKERFLTGHRIEYADALPGFLVFSDETLMGGRFLIDIVGCLIAENDVQTNIEVVVVDLTAQFVGQHTAGEEDDPGMTGQVFAARLQQARSGGCRAIV